MSQITKILFRRGSNAERLSAENIGVTFNVGEPAWVHDTNRMYVGDGVTKGGRPVGMRNLGAVTQLFGTYGNSGYSEIGYNMLLSGVEVGDIVYDRETRMLYSLTGRSNFPPPTGELVKYDFSILLDNDFFFFNNNNELTLQNECIGPYQVASSLVGGGLTKYTTSSPIQIADRAVTNLMLANMPANTVKLNNRNVADSPVDLVVRPKQFVGRSSTSTLTAIDFTTILAEANIQTQNGIFIESPSVTTTIISLCSQIFSVPDDGQSIFIKTRTSVNGALSANGPIISSNNITTSGDIIASNKILCNQLHTRNGIVNAGTGQISGGSVTCRDINTQGFNINAGSGDIYCNRLFATGDITAFFTSDARLKENIIPLNGSLTKLDNINAYTFTWVPSTDYNRVSRSGNDIGLIAQEIHSVIPEAVSVNKEGYYGIDYTRVVPYLLGCVKELKQEVESLKNEIRQFSK
jgi:hypothetical protein